MKDPHTTSLDNCESTCKCTPQYDRRHFIRVTGATAAAASIPQSFTAMAGPFPSSAETDHLIPADKKLSSQWLASLSQRGKPEVYRGNQLRYIGMPIGGICCGQLYLGGDGRLWLWDIFQSRYQSDYGPNGMSKGTHYASPPESDSNQHSQEFDVANGFAVRVQTEGQTPQIRSLDRNGFSQISFRGEYPIGRVVYRDEACPVEIELEAFSPFIPLNAADSSIPATVLSYTVRNEGPHPVSVELVGHLQNSVCPDFTQRHMGRRVNRLTSRRGRTAIEMTAEPALPADQKPREDIVFATFESEEYEDWKPEGTAFGTKPFARSEMLDYHNVSGHQGDRVVNSHNSRQSNSVRGADKHQGTLTSDQFVIDRKFIRFLIGGGRHPNKTCLNLLIDGKVVRTATGHNANQMRSAEFDVADLQGRNAHLQVVDAEDGEWGNIGIDHIVFTDDSIQSEELHNLPGYGSMALSVLQPQAVGATNVEQGEISTSQLFDTLASSQPDKSPHSTDVDFSLKPIGALGVQASLKAGESRKFDFVISWNFPHYRNARGEFAAIKDIHKLRRNYATRFEDAASVANYVADNFNRLAGQTHLWNRTWYDSTLPHWLLDRTFLSIDCLATQTSHWFDNGRFYGWEGVYCCPGTCQHVWNYSQGLARIFPELERTTREHVDYGIAFQDSGELWYRAESGRHIAHDGQCGTILRAYREHTTSEDDAYLKRIWPRIRKSIDFLIDQDGAKDGLLEGRQYNTLDQAWFGPMAWISSMYLATLEAGRKMATEMKDKLFVERCSAILDSAQTNLVSELFDGEYFIHKPPNYKSTNTNDGCHIDQVFGQSLAWQVGLPRVVPKNETKSALAALWKYNFTLDAGGYRNAMQETVKGGRWYAMPGEAGLLMCTWPKGGAEKSSGNGEGFDFAIGYFNECMNGFEYQVAAHMIYEGSAADNDLVEKGLAITRAVHDRYAADKRNPYNEIECSDHYSRSMASYGVFLAVCGFEYHGPSGRIGFSPRLSPEDFKSAFTAAKGWGSFKQQITGTSLLATIELQYGRLPLKVVSLDLQGALHGRRPKSVTVDGNPVEFQANQSQVLVSLGESTVLEAGDSINISVAT